MKKVLPLLCATCVLATGSVWVLDVKGGMKSLGGVVKSTALSTAESTTSASNITSMKKQINSL